MVHPVCSDHSIIFFCIFLSIYYPIYSHMHILQYFLFGFLHFACCVYHTCMCALCILCAQTILSLSFEAMHHKWCRYSYSYLFIFSLPSFWITGFSDAKERLRREVSFPRGFKMSWGDLACTAFAAKPQPATFFRNTEHIFQKYRKYLSKIQKKISRIIENVLKKYRKQQAPSFQLNLN